MKSIPLKKIPGASGEQFVYADAMRALLYRAPPNKLMTTAEAMQRHDIAEAAASAVTRGQKQLILSDGHYAILRSAAEQAGWAVFGPDCAEFVQDIRNATKAELEPVASPPAA